MVMQMHYHTPTLIYYGAQMPISSVLDAESTLTDRYQTTVPEPVRQVLKLGKKDKIHYRILNSGEVVISRAPAAETDDPVLANFLGFLARDMTAQPSRLRTIPAELIERVQALVVGVEIDIDEPLAAEDE